jgi:hypothetical protein
MVQSDKPSWSSELSVCNPCFIRGCLYALSNTGTRWPDALDFLMASMITATA